MKEEARNYRISVTKGISGYFAVFVAEFNIGKSKGWYTDIINTGIGRYKTRKEAIQEAEEWSISDEIPLEKGLISESG